jgi:hypothetical protein
MFLPRLTKPAKSPTTKDRERLDFSRYFYKQDGLQPIPGIPFKVVLKIASEVCHRPIHDLVEIKSLREAAEIGRGLKKWK